MKESTRRSHRLETAPSLAEIVSRPILAEAAAHPISVAVLLGRARARGRNVARWTTGAAASWIAAPARLHSFAVVAARQMCVIVRPRQPLAMGNAFQIAALLVSRLILVHALA